MDYLSKFEELKSKELSLDLTRGKPSSDQLDLSNGLMSFSENDFLYDGVDIRNYGEIKGLDSCRELGAEILGCSKEYVWAGGNSSLSLMSQFLSFLFVEELERVLGTVRKGYQYYAPSLVTIDILISAKNSVLI